MQVDRTELDNLVGKDEPRVAELIREYESWADAAGVLDWDVALPRLLDAWKMEDIHG